MLEIRGEHAGYLKVYDYRRERGGYLRGDAGRPVELSEAAAPELLAVLRFLRESPGSEALGISYGAAYLKAVPPRAITAEAFDAIAQMAERLADQASGSMNHLADFAPHLEVAEQFGVCMRNFERDSRMRVCCDGELFHRVLTVPVATPEERPHAVLGLTRPDCFDPELGPVPRASIDTERSQLLGQVKDGELNSLMRSRLHARSAAVWASLAYATTVAVNPPALRRSGHSRSFSPCVPMTWVMTGCRSTWTLCCGSAPSAGPERCPHRSGDL